MLHIYIYHISRLRVKQLGSNAKNAVSRNKELTRILLPGNKGNIDRWAKKGSGVCTTGCVGTETLFSATRLSVTIKIPCFTAVSETQSNGVIKVLIIVNNPT